MTPIHRSSQFSPDGRYRYWLRRTWNEALIQPLVIMLNPSKAGSLDKSGKEKDDPTIKRLIRDLQHLGYGGFYVVNLYALVSSEPKMLFEIPDALGDNDYWVGHCAMATQLQIIAWGSFKGIDHRAKKMIALFPDALCFGKSNDGKPFHPLALMYNGTKTEDVKLIRYR